MFQLMMYSTFVYGLIPGLFFTVFGIYFMLKLFDTKKWCYGVLTALMCALAIIMKSNYMIILIAIGLTLIVKAISEKYPVYLLYLLLAIAAFIILTLIDHILAKEFYFVAQQKGYTDRKYYWYCFCFTIIGYLLVIALPY